MRTWVRLPSPPPKIFMMYIFTFCFFFSFSSAAASDLALSVEQFKYYSETKNLLKMRESAGNLETVLRDYTKDNCKKFDPLLHCQIVENCYTFVKKLGSKRHVPLYKDWLLFLRSDVRSMLETREQIFKDLYPSLKILHKKVVNETETEQVFADSNTSVLNKVQTIDDLFAQVARDAAQVQRYLLFSRHSKLYGAGSEGGVWFVVRQKQLLDVLTVILEKGDGLSSSAWCTAASLLTRHISVIESTPQKKAPFYYELKNLHRVSVLPHCLQKEAIIPSSLLMSLAFEASSFDKNMYSRSEPLVSLIGKINKKLFDINKVAVTQGVAAVDEKMQRFVYQVALLNHCFISSKACNANGFKEVKSFKKVQSDLRSNLDEIFKILSISRK